MADDAPFLPGLSPVAGKPVQVTFDAGQLTSDGGVLVLAEIERRLGIGERLARCLEGCADSPERGNPDRQLPFLEQLPVEIPLRLRDVEVLRAGHPFAVEAGDDAQHVLPHRVAASTTTTAAEGQNTEVGNGAEVTEVTADSAAEDAGIEPGDVVIAVGDRPVTSSTVRACSSTTL